MNLDDLQYLQNIDTHNILHRIDHLPDQFETAWHHAYQMPLPNYLPEIKQVFISGMGGSAIGGDLLAVLAAYDSPIPISVIRGYELPTWVQGETTLFVASSFSGNTEETLTAYDIAHQRGTRIIGMTTGGKLKTRLLEDGHTLWEFADDGPPRTAIGWSLGLLLGLACRAGWLPDLSADVAATIAHLKTQVEAYTFGVPSIQNPTKQLASQLLGQIPVVVGSGIFEAIARRWKCQFNENSDVWAVYESMPEMNHNAVVGIDQPHDILERQTLIFLGSEKFDHPRVVLRNRLTADLFSHHRIMVEKCFAKGETRLAQLMDAVLFGDYVSYYLAVAYGINPMTITPIDSLKNALAMESM